MVRFLVSRHLPYLTYIVRHQAVRTVRNSECKGRDGGLVTIHVINLGEWRKSYRKMALPSRQVDWVLPDQNAVTGNVRCFNPVIL